MKSLIISSSYGFYNTKSSKLLSRKILDFFINSSFAYNYFVNFVLESLFRVSHKILLFIAFFIIFNISSNNLAFGDTNISQIVVFGDSMSDDGSDDGFGFRKYSNGLVWGEYLGQNLCYSCTQIVAFGGAKSNHENYNNLDWSGLLWQVSNYKFPKNSVDVLYIIWVGHNDILYTKGLSRPSVDENVEKAITHIINNGGKNIVILGLFDITISPAINNKKFSSLIQRIFLIIS